MKFLDFFTFSVVRPDWWSVLFWQWCSFGPNGERGRGGGVVVVAALRSKLGVWNNKRIMTLSCNKRNKKNNTLN